MEKNDPKAGHSEKRTGLLEKRSKNELSLPKMSSNRNESPLDATLQSLKSLDLSKSNHESESRLRLIKNRNKKFGLFDQDKKLENRLAPYKKPRTPTSSTPSTKNKTSSPKKGLNIKVAVRIRKSEAVEDNSGESPVTLSDTDPNTINIITSLGNKKEPSTFHFDNVFGPLAAQSTIFDTIVSPIIDEVLQGFKCTIFAYGQTGTGKTYTMEGNLSSEGVVLDHDAGIIPRTLHALFKKLGDDQSQYSVRASMMEIYNEEIVDLLSEANIDNKLSLANDALKRLQIPGLEEIRIDTTASGISLLKKGSLRRHTSSTLYNSKSSRSHSIFTLTVRTKNGNTKDGNFIKEGKLYLVDLAGSEDSKASRSCELLKRESCNINQSLLSLGRVISALASREDNNNQHVPYRESKLTRILADSLGGESKTCVIATITTAKNSVEETIGTLKYASKAMKVVNQPLINRPVLGKAAIQDLSEEISFLRKKLQLLYEQEKSKSNPVTLNDLMDELQKAKDKISELQNQNLCDLDRYTNSNKELQKSLEASDIKLYEALQRNTILNQKLEETQCKLDEKETEIEKLLVSNRNQLKFQEDLENVASGLLKIATNRSNTVIRLQEELDQLAHSQKLTRSSITELKADLTKFVQKNCIKTDLEIFGSELPLSKDQNVTIENRDSLALDLPTSSTNLIRSINILDADVEYHNGQFSSLFRSFKLCNQTILKKLSSYQKALESKHISWEKQRLGVQSKFISDLNSRSKKFVDTFEDVKKCLSIELLKNQTELSSVLQYLSDQESNIKSKLEPMNKNISKSNCIDATTKVILDEIQVFINSIRSQLSAVLEHSSSIFPELAGKFAAVFFVQSDTDALVHNIIDNMNMYLKEFHLRFEKSGGNLAKLITKYCQEQHNVYNMFRTSEAKNNTNLESQFSSVRTKVNQLVDSAKCDSNSNNVPSLVTLSSTIKENYNGLLNLIAEYHLPASHLGEPTDRDVPPIDIDETLKTSKWKHAEVTNLLKLQRIVDNRRTPIESHHTGLEAPSNKRLSPPLESNQTCKYPKLEIQ